MVKLKLRGNDEILIERRKEKIVKEVVKGK